MKEITRIHIAKIPYDIELVAKKELAAYLKSLEAYGDSEVVDDIEIRMTEILGERGVKRDGVIGEADIDALKKQLGEPSDFMETGDIAVGPEDASSEEKPTRKLYRNVDNAVFGGVLSGIAAYLKVNPLWIRLIFIVLGFGSFGTILLVYIILWIVVPPAKTAADKLQMTGRSVTVASIRELNENEAVKYTSNGTALRIVTLLLGIGCVLGALGAAAITTAVTVSLIMGGRISAVPQAETLFYIAFGLMVACGLLLTALFIFAAYALFIQKLTRRVLISMCVVVALGLASFGTAIAIAQYINIHFAGAAAQQQTMPLPSEAPFHNLTITSQTADVVYVPDSATPHAELQRVSSGNVSASVSNDTLNLTVTGPNSDSCLAFWCSQPRQVITVHGPALAHLTVGTRTSLEYQATSQPQLSVTEAVNATMTLPSGSVDTLNAIMGDKAELLATSATINHVSAQLASATDLELGTVESLSITDQKACPSDSHSQVSAWKISSNTIMLNGAATTAGATKLECTVISISSEDGNDRS